MYIAELQGKVSSKLQRSEDLLTSNVFSFFKYSDRQVYLRQLLANPPFYLDLSHKELEEAQFIFWPSYEDGTEPDLVLIAGDYYLLFEAKFFSGFGEADGTTKRQLERELIGGQKEAKTLKKKFIPVAITAHYSFSKDILDGFDDFIWINWQAISSLLLNLTEEHEQNINDYLFAADLYSLLDRKNLRGFLAFDRLAEVLGGKFPKESIFFSAKTAKYRGDFIGFDEALSNISGVHKYTHPIFFCKQYFKDMPTIEGYVKEPLFFEEED